MYGCFWKPHGVRLWDSSGNVLSGVDANGVFYLSKPDNEFKEAIQKWIIENPVVLDPDIELIERFLAK